MEIYLVRHTQTICPKNICYGQTDVRLDHNYAIEFKNIKTQLPAKALVYSSPLQRCTLLANYLYNNQYTTDARLLEMHFGDWEMKNWNTIPHNHPWMLDFVNQKVPNGESFIELHHRVTDFFTQLTHQTTTKPIVLITHAGVIRSLLCLTDNLPLTDAFTNSVNFGQVFKIIL